GRRRGADGHDWPPRQYAGGIHREFRNCAVELVGDEQELSVWRNGYAGRTGSARSAGRGHDKGRTGYLGQTGSADRKYRDSTGIRVNLQALVGDKEKVAARVHGHA